MATSKHVSAPVLVTGATGTVGREVVARLLERGAAVRAAGRDPERTRSRLGSQVDAVAHDWQQPATWGAALDGAGAVFLVRPPEISDVKSTLQPFVELALRRGVRRVTFLSVQGAGGNPLLPHHTVEQHLKRVTDGWTMLRPAYFFQNLTGVLRDQIRDEDRLSVPVGDGRTAFVDTRDVALVATQTLLDAGHEQQAYELSAPPAHTWFEVARALSDALGRHISYQRPGLAQYLAGELRGGAKLPFALVTSALYTTSRLGLAATTSPELERLLGHPPRGLERFVADSADAWRRA